MNIDIPWAQVLLYLHSTAVVVCALRVLYKQRNIGNALAWLILLFVFPFIGVALYLLVGEPRLGAARAKRTAEMNRFYTEVSERYLNDIHLAVRNDVAPHYRGISHLASNVTGLHATKNNALSLLLLHDIGRRNAQAVWAGLQTGSTYSNITSGKTDILVTHSGEVSADAETASNKPFRWRFIENIYGDCWKILSGVYLNQVGAERRVMICPDPYKANTSSVISADYIQACIIAAGEGWLKDINAPWINAKAYGASSTTGYCDYTYNNTTDKNILLAGGSSIHGASAGPFSLYSGSSASTRNFNIGALFASIDSTKAATQIVKPALIY